MEKIGEEGRECLKALKNQHFRTSMGVLVRLYVYYTASGSSLEELRYYNGVLLRCSSSVDVDDFTIFTSSLFTLRSFRTNSTMISSRSSPVKLGEPVQEFLLFSCSDIFVI